MSIVNDPLNPASVPPALEEAQYAVQEAITSLVQLAVVLEVISIAASAIT